MGEEGRAVSGLFEGSQFPEGVQIIRRVVRVNSVVPMLLPLLRYLVRLLDVLAWVDLSPPARRIQEHVTQWSAVVHTPEVFRVSRLPGLGPGSIGLANLLGERPVPVERGVLVDRHSRLRSVPGACLEFSGSRAVLASQRERGVA